MAERLRSYHGDTDLMVFGGCAQHNVLTSPERKEKFETIMKRLLDLTSNKLDRERQQLKSRFTGSSYAFECKPVFGSSNSFRIFVGLRSNNVEEWTGGRRGIPLVWSNLYHLKNRHELEALLNGLEEHLRSNIASLESLMQKIAYDEDLDINHYQKFKDILTPKTEHLIKLGSNSRSEYVTNIMQNLKGLSLPFGLSAIFSKEKPEIMNIPVIEKKPT